MAIESDPARGGHVPSQPRRSRALCRHPKPGTPWTLRRTDRRTALPGLLHARQTASGRSSQPTRAGVRTLGDRASSTLRRRRERRAVPKGPGLAPNGRGSRGPRLRRNAARAQRCGLRRAPATPSLVHHSQQGGEPSASNRRPITGNGPYARLGKAAGDARRLKLALLTDPFRRRPTAHAADSARGSKRDLMAVAPDLCPPSWWRRRVELTDVWGRLRWDEPSNTVRTCCNNASKGRYIHPEQDRVISLREAARLQSNPGRVRFRRISCRRRPTDRKRRSAGPGLRRSGRHFHRALRLIQVTFSSNSRCW